MDEFYQGLGFAAAVIGIGVCWFLVNISRKD